MKKLKGFVLAAGLGTRLKPLTNERPKPLLPFFGVPLLFIILEQLAELNVDEIFVNGHHLSHQIKEAIQNYSIDTKVTFSDETSKLLGTAGAIGAIKSKVGDADLIVINGDIVSNFTLRELIHTHYTESAFATMGLLKHIPPQKTPVWCDKEKILGFGTSQRETFLDLKKHSFACIQILSNGFIQSTENTPSEIIPLYQKHILGGEKISYFVNDPFWSDIGSPQSYFEAHTQGISQLNNSDFMKSIKLRVCWKKLKKTPIFNNSSFILNPVNKEDLLNLGSNVFSFDSGNISKGIKTKNCILLAEARPQQGAALENVIVSGMTQVNIRTASTFD